MNDSPYLLVITQQRKGVPLITPVEYTPVNPFVLKSTSTPSVPSLAEQTSRLTLSPKPNQFTPILILQAKPVPRNDVTEIGSMPRSGRVYKQEELQKGQQLVAEEGPDLKKKKVSDAEAEEFVKMLKRSEYSVVGQLKRAPTQISILSLLTSS